MAIPEAEANTTACGASVAPGCSWFVSPQPAAFSGPPSAAWWVHVATVCLTLCSVPPLRQTSTAYTCADGTGSHSSCCPSTDPINGNQPYMTIYDKTHQCDADWNHPNYAPDDKWSHEHCHDQYGACNSSALSCQHVDIPWTLACDAGREDRGPAAYYNDFLDQKCEANEGTLLKVKPNDKGYWGCTVACGSNCSNWTNRQALLTLTNNTYLFGQASGSVAFKAAPDKAACDAANVTSDCGLFPSALGAGCHFNMVTSCLGSTGLAITALCTYIGLTLLMVGSLWVSVRLPTYIHRVLRLHARPAALW
jgi:hypothetical protein